MYKNIPDWVFYLSYIFLVGISVLVSGWLDAQIRPIMSLPHVQDAMLGTISFLATYTVFVFGFVFVNLLFRTQEDSSESGKDKMSHFSIMLCVGALVGMPLLMMIIVLLQNI